MILWQLYFVGKKHSFLLFYCYDGNTTLDFTVFLAVFLTHHCKYWKVCVYVGGGLIWDSVRVLDELNKISAEH